MESALQAGASVTAINNFYQQANGAVCGGVKQSLSASTLANAFPESPHTWTWSSSNRITKGLLTICGTFAGTALSGLAFTMAAAVLMQDLDRNLEQAGLMFFFRSTTVWI